MPNMIWYELKVTIGQKLPKKTEMDKNEQKNEQFFVLFWQNPRMANERKALQEYLDSLRK